MWAARRPPVAFPEYVFYTLVPPVSQFSATYPPTCGSLLSSRALLDVPRRLLPLAYLSVPCGPVPAAWEL